MRQLLKSWSPHWTWENDVAGTAVMAWSVKVTSGVFARDFPPGTNAGQESKIRTPDDYGFQESFAPSSEL